MDVRLGLKRKLWRGLGIAAMGFVLTLTALKLYLDTTYFRGYDPQAPLAAQVASVENKAQYIWTRLYYRGALKDRVPAVLALPREGKGPFPCVIFVHGIGDDKQFMAENKLDEPFVKAGFAFVCFDQLMRGERKQKGLLNTLAAFRVRASCTVNDTRKLLDYLDTRPDIATNRIYLCGASYGAMTGCTAMAFDKRIQAGVLVYGGGLLKELLFAPTSVQEVGRWRYVLWPVTWYFASVWDPVKYVGAIAPRPLLIQNGKADTIIPQVCARALQTAAGQPKQIKWYEGDHLGKTSELDLPLVKTVLADALDFIQQQDAKITSRKP